MQPHALDLPPSLVRHATHAGGVLIVADDLTGACDSAVAFLATGRTVRVALESTSLIPSTLSSNGIVAMSTESRSLPQREAVERVTNVFESTRVSSRDALLFKKVDSAARGHFAAETLAALNASDAVLALVAPAFPQAGRTVRNGVLRIRDSAAQDNRLALRDLFSTVGEGLIQLLPTSSEAEVECRIHTALSQGTRVLLCDSETQADVDQISAVALRLERPMLWAGSAGLARGLAAALAESQPASATPAFRSTRAGRTLLCFGTDHPVTTLQLSHLRDLAGPPVHQALDLIHWSNVTPQQIRAAFAGQPTAALVLTGGDTASYVLHALDAASIQLAGEVAPGIPWGIIESGAADGCLVVTKSGGFGAPDALAHAIHFCNRRSQ